MSDDTNNDTNNTTPITLFTAEELKKMANTFDSPSYKPPLKAELDKLVIDYELSSNVNTILQSYIVVKTRGGVF